MDGDKSIRLKHEIDSLKNLRHPNIIQLYEVNFLLWYSIYNFYLFLKIMETPKLICLVTEYASNGELYGELIKFLLQ